MTGTTEAAHANTKNRYPGSPPFDDTDLDQQLFFGRRHDSSTALHSVLSHDLFVLYGRSGIGKTSLLKAGVLHELRQRDLWPILTRLNDVDQGPVELIRAAMIEQGDQRLIEVFGAERKVDGLSDLVSGLEIWRDDVLQLPVLIFDQFEELFTLWDEARRNHFIAEFADVVRPKATHRFGADEPHLTDLRPRLKVVLVLREDFLGHLEAFSTSVPLILAHRQRLGPLTLEQATEAIEGPAGYVETLPDDNDAPSMPTDSSPQTAKGTRIKSPPFRFDAAALNMLIDFLRTHEDRGESILTNSVEPPQLQVICQHVERVIVPSKANGDSEITITPEDLHGPAGLREILRDYYRREIQAFSPKDQALVRRLCERGLISRSSRRLSLEVGEIKATYGVAPDLLSELVDRRLIRSEPRVGSTYFELAHDTLVAPILSYRSQVAATRTRRRRRNAAIGAAAVILGLIALQVTTLVTRGNQQRFIGSLAPATDPERLSSRTAPSVVGLTETDAVELIEAAGLKVDTNKLPSPLPEGQVISQVPAAGEEATNVVLSLSGGAGMIVNDIAVSVIPGEAPIVIEPLTNVVNVRPGETLSVAPLAPADPQLAVNQVGNTIEVSAAAPGTYEVAYVVADSVEEKEGVLTVTAVQLEALAAPSSTTVSAGGVVVFVDKSTGLGITRTWTFSDDDATSQEARVEHEFLTPGDYVVELAVEDRAGNRESDTVQVVVEDGPRTVTFVAEDINLRTGPGIEFDKVGSRDEVEGQTIQVDPKPVDGWYRIASGFDEGSWLFGALIVPQDGGIQVGETLTGEPVELLDENGEPLTSEINGVVEPRLNPSGRLVLVEGVDGDLYTIRLPDGSTARVRVSEVRILVQAPPAQSPDADPLG